MKSSLILIFIGISIVTFINCNGKAPDSKEKQTKQVEEEYINPLDTFSYSDFNSVARILAGKTVDDANFLPNLVNSQNYKNHVTSFESLWKSHKVKLDKITDWSSKNLTMEDTVFYPFGGPDFNYLDAFFPNCRFTVLIGLEKGGKIPFSDSLSIKNSAEILNMVSQSVKSNLGNSYFRTNSMKKDLAGYLEGTLPIIMMFMSRHNYDIVNVNPVFLNNQGLFEYTYKDMVYAHTMVKDYNDSYEIIYKNPTDTILRKLYYFSMDISDTVMNKQSFTLMMSNYFKGKTTFLKAASYLLHWPEFSVVRDLILQNSSQIVTGPSGMPYKFVNNDSWQIDLHGTYVGPISLFQGFVQKDMIEAYKNGKPKSIPFVFDYHPTNYGLIVARKKV